MTDTELFDMISATARAQLAPVLAGRQARCSCGKRRPSSIAKTDEFAFEYRGAGSHAATQCKHCGYFECAHETGLPHLRHVCEHYEPHGAHEFDLFYCGCRGWD